MQKLSAVALMLFTLVLPAQAATVEEALARPERLAADLERDKRDRPAVVIPLLEISSGDRVADIFGGAGYYSEIIGAMRLFSAAQERLDLGDVLDQDEQD